MTIAHPRGGARDLRYPVIVIDADERPTSISPALRLVLGLDPGVPPPGSLEGIMDEASAWRVHSALRHRDEAPTDPLALTLIGQGGRSRTAAVEFLPTTEGGAVLVVSLDPGPWSGPDAALFLDRCQDLVLSARLTPAFSFRYVNPASAAVTGYTPDELQADPSIFAEAVHPDDRALLPAALADAQRLEAPVIFRFLHRGGEWRWFEFFGTPITDETGRVTVVNGIIRDVTVRHRFEEQFRLLAERSPEMVYRIRLLPDCATDYMSPACVAVTGHQPEEFYADPWLLLRYVHPDDCLQIQEWTDHPDDYSNRPLRFRAYHPDGSIRWIEQVHVPVRDEAGRLLAIEGICRDVTERQEVETALQEMNRRMSLLTCLTRHDILNQLTVLLGSLELAGTAENTAELAWFLGRSRHAAWAIHRLMEFTRDYQEIGQGAPAWVPVSALAQRAADSFTGDRVSIEVRDEPWEILADPLIEQVFFNLIENSLRHGGSIERIRFFAEAQPSGELVITCEDDGAGVPVNEKERIFEHGYGLNTGLGLYLSREILASTGMTIAETGRPGVGARFDIGVPPAACRPSSAGGPADGVPPWELEDGDGDAGPLEPLRHPA